MKIHLKYGNRIIIFFLLLFSINGCSSRNDNTVFPETTPIPQDTAAIPADQALPEESDITQDDSNINSAIASDVGDSSSSQPIYITGDGVRLREAPSTQAEVLIVLSYGMEAELLEGGDDWSMVRYDNTTGYVRNDLLGEARPAPRPSIPEADNPFSTNVSGNVSQNTDEDITSPRIIVRKEERILELWDSDRLHSSYAIGLGREPSGDKKEEGDGRTPEGSYYVCTRNSNSRFYLSLGISYPNKEDAREALDNATIDQDTHDQIVYAIDNETQPPWNTALGGEIMIHGHGSSSDWTAGCIAVNDDVMDILWERCPIGTAVIIKP